MNSNKRNKILIGAVVILLLVFTVFAIIRSVRNYKSASDNHVWLVENTQLATSNNNNIKSGSLILPSNDNKYGIEMAYSFWIYLDGWSNPTNSTCDGNVGINKNLKHVFHKGDPIGLPSQSPGVWLQKIGTSVEMVIKMNTFNVSPSCEVGSNDPDINNESCYLEKCVINNIPVKKWVHFTVIVINTNIDIYVNGYLKKRCLLKGIPRLNQGDVYIASTTNLNGFDGYISRLKYYNYALPIWQIERNNQEGPSSQIDQSVLDVIPPYLASNWWMRRIGLGRNTRQEI